MNYVFFIGNKRSGTSILCGILNQHPDVHVSFESDLLWILYQTTCCESLVPYHRDGPLGFNETIKLCHESLQNATSNQSIEDLFVDLHQQLMKKGTSHQKPHPTKKPRWIGDKKPVQQADPVIQDFIDQHFAEAKFIHIIREPFNVINSMQEAVQSWPVFPEYWKSDSETLLLYWIEHERWVIKVKERKPDLVISIRYEDLCRHPLREVNKIFRFLNLSPRLSISMKLPFLVSKSKRKTIVAPTDDKQLKQILKLYNYY